MLLNHEYFICCLNNTFTSIDQIKFMVTIKNSMNDICTFTSRDEIKGIFINTAFTINITDSLSKQCSPDQAPHKRRLIRAILFATHPATLKI